MVIRQHGANLSEPYPLGDLMNVGHYLVLQLVPMSTGDGEDVEYELMVPHNVHMVCCVRPTLQHHVKHSLLVSDSKHALKLTAS